MTKKITLKEYLQELVKRAHGTPHLLPSHVNHRNRVPQLANFIREHDLVGTVRGSARWRRNDHFYERNAHV